MTSFTGGYGVIMSKPTTPLTLEVTSLLRRLLCHKGDCLCGHVDVKDMAPEIVRVIKLLETPGTVVSEHMDGATTVYPPVTSSRLTN